MKMLKPLSIILTAIIFSLNATVSLADTGDKAPSTEDKAVDEKCQAPVWAIAIGHEDKWKLHNGCVEQEEKKD